MRCIIDGDCSQITTSASMENPGLIPGFRLNFCVLGDRGCLVSASCIVFATCWNCMGRCLTRAVAGTYGHGRMDQMGADGWIESIYPVCSTLLHSILSEVMLLVRGLQGKTCSQWFSSQVGSRTVERTVEQWMNLELAFSMTPILYRLEKAVIVLRTSVVPCILPNRVIIGLPDADWRSWHLCVVRRLARSKTGHQ